VVVKKVKNPRKSASKALRIRSLADYIRNPETGNRQEKCVQQGSRGFLTATFEGQKAEMLALSQEAVRSKDTVNHYVLSWQEGEVPSPEQIEQAVDVFLGELGLREHQAIFGVHVDTDNRHLHIAVNRVHPDTLKVIKPNKGFDIEAAHQAIARIEHIQGWKREERGRYQVEASGALARDEASKAKPRQPSQPKRDMEQRTGEKSAERIAIENAPAIVKTSRSWEELHHRFAVAGMRYEKTGSGATIFIGEVGVKASSADRGASLAQLQKRFGPYEPPGISHPVAERKPEPIGRGVPGWETYIAGRKAHSAARGYAINEQRQRHQAERKQLAAEQRNHRHELLMRTDWQGKGPLRNAWQSIIAAEQAAAKAILAERQDSERHELRQRFRPYPDLEQWHRQQKNPHLAEQWRYRSHELPGMEGEEDDPPRPRGIAEYSYTVQGREVHYSRKTSTPGDIAFIDRGRRIEIQDWRNRDSVLAALQLSHQKWGSITVTGNEQYKAMCVELAAEHGFHIVNPELQESIKAQREMRRIERYIRSKEIERSPASER
jgi:hypothetical protein